MDFQEFLRFVPKLIDARLPAFDAHIKMAPLERLESLRNSSFGDKKPRMAAVMMLFYPKNNSTHLVLIVRNSYEGVHSAQIAFPGGKCEFEDENFACTALRETHEEIGIRPDKIEILKPFTELYIPPSNFLVTPYLGFSTEDLEFTPNPDEVKRVLELPIHQLLNDEIIVQTKMTTSYATNIDVPAFQVEKYVVWGATAMMLSELKELFKNAVK